MPRDGSIVPLFGVANKGLSPVVTAQQRINLYVHAPDGDKEGIKLYPRPGLTNYGVGGSIVFGGPLLMRGLMDGEIVRATALAGYETIGVGVCGRTFMTLQPAYATVGNVGSVLTDTGPVRFARNPTQALAVDGRTGYIYTFDHPVSLTTLEGLAGAEWFPAGATTCCFLAGRFYANKPRTGQAWYSDLNTGLTGGASNFITAESDPDNLQAVASAHGELLLYGEYTTEFWAPNAGSGDPVVRVGGSAIEWGLAAVGSLRKIDGGMMFLGRNRLGDVRVLRLSGYSAQPVSTPDIETQIQAIEDVGGGEAMAFTANGHSFYVLSFLEKTFVYDLTSGTWGEFQTGTSGGRWVGQYGSFVAGRFFVTDYRSNALYLLDPEAYTDAGETIVREVVTRHTFSDYDRTSVYRLGVDFETGVGLVSGQGSDPQAMLQVSRDNGRTWGNEMWQGLGALGSYVRRVWWTRLGRARDWLFRIRVSDPVKVVIAGGSLKVGP